MLEREAVPLPQSIKPRPQFPRRHVAVPVHIQEGERRGGQVHGLQREIVSGCMRERESERDRQTDRQTETDRETERERERERRGGVTQVMVMVPPLVLSRSFKGRASI